MGHLGRVAMIALSSTVMASQHLGWMCPDAPMPDAFIQLQINYNDLS